MPKVLSGGARDIARQHAETAGIGVDLVADRHLHREVGDAGVGDEGCDRRCHGDPIRA